MMDFIAQHKLLSLLLLVLLIGAAWWGFTQSATPAPILSGSTDDTVDAQDADLVSSLLQLQTVNLSGTILSDPGFLSLQDFTTQIVSEPVGRPNPFAPVSGTAAPTSTPKVNPNLFAPAKH